ncbi:hypothetical protein DPMN_079101 [Dreissena polymorpha]|uniref:Uncharacterized protein n=1 Tax=Dreissena polymorpha TaxID=45954 RepID=A0A9D3YQ47_DREPO|nr:hypothetical protein DPMN_079101 [Dreissena polymorpha]
MARQRPTRLVMGPCIVEIDRIVIREVQYQLEVNRCRNEESIVKGNFGWAWPMWAGRPRIDCIVIREVQYQIEVNRCRNEEMIRGLCGRGAPGLVMGPCIVEIDRIVIREVQYQFEDNRCRNEEIIFQGSSANSDERTDGRTAEITTISTRISKSVGKKATLGGCGLLWAGPPMVGNGAIHNVHTLYSTTNITRNGAAEADAGAPGLVMGPCIVEIDRIVIREVQYQLQVNRCRNEEIIVKGKFGWAWPMRPGRPRIDRIVIREAQYQFE